MVDDIVDAIGIIPDFLIQRCQPPCKELEFSSRPQPLRCGQGQNFSWVFRAFLNSPFHLSILNMHKWGKTFLYPSSKTKKSGGISADAQRNRQTHPASINVRQKATKLKGMCLCLGFLG